MDFCQTLLRLFGRPIVSTSANLSGHPSPQCYADIAEELKQRVDCCLPDLPEFRHPTTGSSRILKVNPDGTVTVIRG
jgi:L-threonylcarbamoyladenylate synthase